ncbi:MAG: alpha/beta hydrolase [Chloroflexota bacterium]
MAPRIQYATTSDGLKIAFSSIGRGPVLLYLPQPLMTPLQAYEQVPAIRSFTDRLAESFQVVRFDHRGSGLSTRSADSFVMEPLLRDVEAVIDKLGAQELSVFAEFDSGPVAISLAANRPALVKNLIFWCSWSRSLDVFDKDTWTALNSLLDTNMQLYFETIGQGSLGGTGLDVRETMKPVVEGVERETLKKAIEDFWLLDASDLLGSLRCPTLVLHREGLLMPLEQTVDLASRIPEGRFVVLPGVGGVPWAGDVEEVLRAVEDFLLPDRVNPERFPQASTLRTVLFTDLVGHAG